MKKIFFIFCLIILNTSFANGVLCNITQPLQPTIFIGANATFSAICSNNTSNRNYTDFYPININQPGLVAVTTSCPNQQLPVGASCIISGVFSPTSASNNTFNFGLHYGGTDYPSYPTLTFSTIVRTITFANTLGPDGGDIVDYTWIPSINTGVKKFYVYATNLDLADVDFFHFNGAEFKRTNFPFSTSFQITFLPSSAFTADKNDNLYVGTINNLASLITDVYKYTFANDTWTSTGYISTGGDPIISLATNSEDRIYAVTQNQSNFHTQVWEYDPLLNTWGNTNYPNLTAGDLSAFSPNQKPVYLVANTNGLIYGMTSQNDVYQYTPGEVAGAGVWVSTSFNDINVIPRSITFDSTNNVFVGADDGNAVNYEIYMYDQTTWTQTNFPAATPPFPSFVADESGSLYATGDLGAGLLGAFKYSDGTWTDLAFPVASQSMSLQVLDNDTNKLYLDIFDANNSNPYQVWVFDPMTTWTNQNFPSATNHSVILLLSLDAEKQIYNLQLNGLYKLIGTTWHTNNRGLHALTSHYVLKNNDGTLYTLNARQANSPSCTSVAGYDPIWNDRPDSDGFIDILQHRRFSAWEDSQFPAQANAIYAFAPLVTRNNTSYAISINQAGNVFDVWRHDTTWVTTNFPAPAGTIFYCAQNGGLAEDFSSNLYVINNNVSYGVYRFDHHSLTWSQVTTGLPVNPTLIEQLISDSDNVIYAIVDNDVFKLDPISLTWSSTNFAGFRGIPKHLMLDTHHNLYAVNEFSNVWKRSAADQAWSGVSLGFPAGSAGTIYQDFFADVADNLYARTQQGSANSVWEFVNETQTWRDLGTFPGFPTTAIINRLTGDQLKTIYLATSQGLFGFSGYSWFRLSTENVTDFLSNFIDAYYLVTNNHGVQEGTVS